MSLRTAVISALVFIALAAPGSAYYFDFAASGTSQCDVHLHFDGYSDASILAASITICCRFDPNYGKNSNIAWQIEEHAVACMGGYNRDQTNPMDIEVNDGPC